MQIGQNESWQEKENAGVCQSQLAEIVTEKWSEDTFLGIIDLSVNPNTPELWEMLVTRGVVEAVTRL